MCRQFVFLVAVNYHEKNSIRESKCMRTIQSGHNNYVPHSTNYFTAIKLLA
jgi:hypothetical protein